MKKTDSSIITWPFPRVRFGKLRRLYRLLGDNAYWRNKYEATSAFFATLGSPFFCFVFFPSALAQEKLPEIVKKIEPSTVIILTYDKDGKITGQWSI